MKSHEKYKMIESYLNGTLSSEELECFEDRLERDKGFQKEIDDHQVLLDSMLLYGRRKKMKMHLNKLHEEITYSPQRQTSLWKNAWQKYFSTVAVAAAVAIVTVIGIAWNVNNIKTLDTKQNSYYMALKKDLDKVKATQKTIVQNSKEDDKKGVINHTATAFVVGSNGYLITNYHVVKDAKDIYIHTKGEDSKMLHLEIAKTDKQRDLALLQIVDSSFIGFEQLPYAFDDEVADLGQDVFTLAYPRKDMVYGQGTISSKSGFEGDTLAYQISIPVNPGNSGSPLLNENGDLIGIISGKNTNQEGAAYAVKSKYLKELVNEVCKDSMASNNSIRYLKRVQQIQKLEDFVFELKIYSKPIQKR